MRVKKKSAEPLCMSDSELMRRSLASAKEALLLIDRCFESFAQDLSELSRLTDLRPKAQSDEIKKRMRELDAACENYEARVLWYVNLFVTNNEKAFLIVERDSPKRCIRLRVKAGKTRAEILGRLDALVNRHNRLAKLIPIASDAGTRR